MTTMGDNDSIVLLWRTDDTTVVFFDELPDYYYIIVATLAQLSSILSILGSSLMLWLILREQQWHTSIIERFLCGLSLADWIASWGMLLQLHLLPTWTGLAWSRGSLVTCQAAGALNLVMIVSFLYSCCLATYFLRTLGEPSQKQRWGVGERMLHGALWTLPLLAILGTLTADLIQPSPFFGACVVVDPASIENYSNPAGYVVVSILSVVFPVCLLYGLVCGVLLYCKVRKLVRIEAAATNEDTNHSNDNVAIESEDDPSGIGDAMMSYDGLLSSSSSTKDDASPPVERSKPASSDGNNQIPSSSSSSSPASRRDPEDEHDPQQQRTQRHHQAAERMIARQNRFVTHQALFYCLAFLNSMAPSSIAEVVRLTLWSSSSSTTPPQPSVNAVILGVTAVVVALFYLLVPLQGWINCIIYLRPRLWCWREAHPEQSWGWIAWQILVERQPLPRRGVRSRTSVLSDMDSSIE